MRGGGCDANTLPSVTPNITTLMEDNGGHKISSELCGLVQTLPNMYCTNVHTYNTTIQSYLCLMKGHYQLFIVFAKALSCLSLVEDGGKARDIMLHTHMLTHQTSLVMEEFLDSEVDNCSSSSFLYRKLSLLAEWLL